MTNLQKPEGSSNRYIQGVILDHTGGWFPENVNVEGKPYTKKQESILHCARKYSRISYNSTLSYLSYRIQQMFRAIIGCSDWQIAKRNLTRLIRTDEDSIVNKKQVKTGKAWDYLAEGMLKSFVNAYDEGLEGDNTHQIRERANRIIRDSIVITGQNYRARFQNGTEDENSFVFSFRD